MDPKTAAARVMARMALADQEVTDDERWLLVELVGSDEEAAALLDQVADAEVAELVAPVTLYADRFFLAFRAYVMAHADEVIDDRERSLFEELLRHLALVERDRELIESVGRSILGGRDAPPDRFRELYEQSSFRTTEQSSFRTEDGA